MKPPSVISISVPGGPDCMQVVLDGRPRFVLPMKTRRIGVTRWGTIAPFVWYDGKNIRRLPVGYEWDGASVPAFGHWYESHGSHLEMSGPHDHGYQFHWFWTWRSWQIGWVAQAVGKHETDWTLRVLADVDGVRHTKAWLLWDAVRVGGWCSWYFNTCNGKCDVCPCDAGGWCPYVGQGIKPETQERSLA